MNLLIANKSTKYKVVSRNLSTLYIKILKLQRKETKIIGTAQFLFNSACFLDCYKFKRTLKNTCFLPSRMDNNQFISI